MPAGLPFLSDMQTPPLPSASPTSTQAVSTPASWKGMVEFQPASQREARLGHQVFCLFTYLWYETALLDLAWPEAVLSIQCQCPWPTRPSGWIRNSGNFHSLPLTPCTGSCLFLRVYSHESCGLVHIITCLLRAFPTEDVLFYRECVCASL